jgi:hypothetical protein
MDGFFMGVNFESLAAADGHLTLNAEASVQGCKLMPF